MGRIPGATSKGAKQREETDRLLTVLRDPNTELGRRLASLDSLIGRRGLTEDEQFSVSIHRGELARLVAERPGAEYRGPTIRYHTDAQGDLRRSLLW